MKKLWICDEHWARKFIRRWVWTENGMDRAEWAEGRVCREVGRVGGAVCGRVGAFDQGACEFGGRWAACGWVGRLRRVSESSEGGRARRRRDGGKRGD